MVDRESEREREIDLFVRMMLGGCGFGMALGLWWILLRWVWTFMESTPGRSLRGSLPTSPSWIYARPGRNRNLATAQQWIFQWMPHDGTATAFSQGLWWSDPALLWRRVSSPPLSGQLLLWIGWDQWDPSVPFWHAVPITLRFSMNFHKLYRNMELLHPMIWWLYMIMMPIL